MQKQTIIKFARTQLRSFLDYIDPSVHVINPRSPQTMIDSNQNLRSFYCDFEMYIA